MIRTIYRSPAEAVGRAAGWTITQDPLRNDNHRLVRFSRRKGMRYMLDKIAEWQPEHPWWNPRRWVPTERTVPLAILDIVHRHMKEFGGS